jgi:glycosyltransferase involved in cell wall biosynthesis
VPNDRVSVIIPVRNGLPYVLEAIASCLAQTSAVTEIILVDDGSTDGTAQTVSKAQPTVRVLSQTWHGTGRALNAGIAAADPGADFICFIDHDDLWQPDKVAFQLETMRGSPDIDAVFGHAVQFISPDLTPTEAALLRVPTAPQPAISISAMMIRRLSLERMGPFPETLDAFAFAPWYVRARHEGLAAAVIEPVVVKRRVHRTNSTRSGKAYYNQAYLDLARAATLQRRDRKG